MVALSASALPTVAGVMPVPTYARESIRIGIVHLGVGGFHRAHQAMYLDRLMNAGAALDWGICGVGVLPHDERMRDALRAQDGLYTLVVKQPDGSLQPAVVGSIVEYLLAPDDPQAVIEKMAAPETRIVSLTITEGGYNIDPVTGEFDASTIEIARDAQPGAVPGTAFGLLTEALVRRRERGLEPFTVLSCDNIEGNGDVARRMFTAFARLRDEELGQWVGDRVAFPNSMVDRITPVTTDADRAALAERFLVDDAWPVMCEPFTQWVVEDHFPLGRPPLEEAGVQLVDDVTPYELMKLRLLNAGHQAMCYLGVLAGYEYAHQVCQDPLLVAFLNRYMDREATPTLRPVPGVDLAQYKQTLLDRFANPEIRDTLARLCADGSDRIPKWVLPVIRENLAADGEIDCAALVVAAWARYAEGTDEQGEPIKVVDRLSDRLREAAARQRTDPTAFLDQRELFGDLVEHDRFVSAYTAALHALHAHGAIEAVRSLAASGG